ncbi:MAG: hypothetical protein ACOVOT_05435 [Rubrivivax sp.]
MPGFVPPSRPARIGGVPALAAAALACSAAVFAQPVQPAPARPVADAEIGPQLSPGVSWEPHGPLTRAVGLRRLNPAEVALARQRYEGFYAALTASEHFRTPTDRVHMVTSSAAIQAPDEGNRARAPVLQQSITAYWTVPRDVRRLPSGVLTPKLGGAHDLVYFELNRVPRADLLEDRRTYGDFSRGVDSGRHGGYFAMPAVMGNLGGGMVYADEIVLTRDGRPVLVPAPLGAVLDLEIARLAGIVRVNESIEASRRAEAEAMMAADKVAERRARREAIWARETRDPALLARRLDAAHAGDIAEAERLRRDSELPATPDPRHRTWGPKLALDAAQRLATSLDAAGRAPPACARKEPGFLSNVAARFAPVTGSGADCVPMVQVRDDVLDPTRPLDEVQVLTVSFVGSRCGEVIGGVRPLPAAGRCGRSVPLLREMDWSAARRAMGWP